jgi:ATP-dependent DNA helicase RecG
MVSMLPDESMERLRKVFGPRLDTLGPVELQALITADVEDSVSNARMQEVTTEHPADLTRILQGLANQGFLRQKGQKRGAVYYLPGRDSIHLPVSSEKITGDSMRKGGTPYTAPGDSLHKTRDLASLTLEERRKLEVIAAASQPDTRLRTEEMRSLILALCTGIYLTAVELGQLLNRNTVGLRTRFLGKMVAEGLLLRKYPDEPNRPDQAYTTRRQRYSGGA